MGSGTDRFNYALVVEYDGSGFCGFQYQENAPTIQGALEKALATVLRQTIRIFGSGRTDSGVHAVGQVVSFDSSSLIDEVRLIKSLNALLPKSVAVRHVTGVPPGFHARFSCLAREYEYLIWNSPVRSTHLERRALWVKHPLPVEQLNDELQTIIGSHDFAALTPVVYQNKGTTRYVDSVALRSLPTFTGESNSLVGMRIRGNAFLHNMIRILVGTLLDKARGKIGRSLEEIIDSRDRLQAGQTAPAHALYFLKAYYRPMEGVTCLPALIDYPTFRHLDIAGNPAGPQIIGNPS